MTFLSRLFGTNRDPREAMRPLWHDVVAVSREPEWYADCAVADTVDGRFDMISVVLALVLIRMETSEELAPATALITELFVEDMDRQLRETGVGDLMVGKKIGKLMEALGGRLGVLREAMVESDAKLAEILQRNVALADESRKPYALAVRTRQLSQELALRPDEALAAGTIRS